MNRYKNYSYRAIRNPMELPEKWKKYELCLLVIKVMVDKSLGLIIVKRTELLA
jgi:hypothetical protein